MTPSSMNSHFHLHARLRSCQVTGALALMPKEPSANDRPAAMGTITACRSAVRLATTVSAPLLQAQCRA